jgi:acetoin utilization protein AcuB
MLVRERMSSPVVSIPPETPVNEALSLMHERGFERLPVVVRGRLVGIVTEKHLLLASPSPATSLSMWEINYLLSKLTVEKVMSREVVTVGDDTPIEEAARIMADRQISGLPVMHGKTLVGIITETDLFKLFLEFMGARERGVRATLLVKEEMGGLAHLARAIADAGGNIVAMGLFRGENAASRTATVKVGGITMEALEKAIRPHALRVIDLRSL